MKKLLMAVFGMLTIAAALPAVAGGDVQSDQLRNRELARREKLAQLDKDKAAPEQISSSGTSATPPQTEGHARMERMMQHCADMMKKS